MQWGIENKVMIVNIHLQMHQMSLLNIPKGVDMPLIKKTLFTQIFF